MRGEPYFFKINKYSFLGARTSYGALVIILSQHFISPIVEEDLPRSVSTKDKRKNIFEVHEQSEDNDIFNDQPSSKKLKDFKPTTSSTTNLALSTILDSFTSLKIKTKVFQTTQCQYDKDSYDLIFYDLFLNI